MLSLQEKEALIRLTDEKSSPLYVAIAKVFQARRAEMMQNCSGCMSSVPRQIERAADFAAKAEAYASVMDDIEAALR